MSDFPEREGGDITAADMLVEDEVSAVAAFYSGCTILITGATGYLGKIALEKLLRDCGDLNRVYVMVRPKKGKDVRARFEEIFDGPSMEPLKRKRPDFRQQVVLLNGDCTLPNLGLSKEDQQKIIEETNIVVHCAATVRFDEKLRTAANINVRAVLDLMALAKQMKNLKAFIHVSTAFSNCPRKEIGESFYEPPMVAEKLLALTEVLDDDKLDKITPVILGDYPNTYVFTKAVAEDVVRREGKVLPAVVVRPSVVIASVKEPVAGWIDNLYGATGVLIGAAVGVLRVLNGRKENKAEMIPADYAMNCALVVGWDIATKKAINENKEQNDFKDEVPVYNVVSSPESPITWDIYTQLAEKHAKQIPSPRIIWHYFFFMIPHRFQHLIAVFFLHTLPAYFIDFILACLGKKPMMVKGYQKINKFAGVIAYFSTREWKFSNDNVQNLWKKLNKKDKEIFEFSMKNFNWDAYFYTYMRGARTYLLKDPLSTLKEGTVKYYKVMVLHYALISILVLLFYKLLVVMLNCFF